MALSSESAGLPKADVSHEETASTVMMDEKTKNGDDALKFIANQDIEPITPEEEKRVLRKIDWRLLPILMLLNTLQLVDKSASLAFPRILPISFQLIANR
jgi:hypothetical protein